jgi:heme-degrading monooxygenase HmoA
MFIAMNRFRVKKGSEEAFEKVWPNPNYNEERYAFFC